MCWRIYFCGSALHLCHMKVITVEPWVAFRPPSSPKWGSSKGREARTSPHRARGILHPVCSVLLRIRGRLRYNDEKRWNMKEDTEIVNKRIWMRSHAALYSFRSIDWLVGQRPFACGRSVAFTRLFNHLTFDGIHSCGEPKEGRQTHHRLCWVSNTWLSIKFQTDMKESLWLSWTKLCQAMWGWTLNRALCGSTLMVRKVKQKLRPSCSQARWRRRHMQALLHYLPPSHNFPGNFPPASPCLPAAPPSALHASERR